MSYVELQVTSNFSFLRGASHPEELVEQAAAYGYTAIALTDCNTLAGMVRAHVAAKNKNIRLVVGCRLDLQDGPGLLAYPANREAYSRLTSLLSTGNIRTEKGKCDLYKQDVFACVGGMKWIMIPPSVLNQEFDFEKEFYDAVKEYSDVFGKDLYMAATRYYRGDDQKYLYQLSQLASRFHIPLVATNDVVYHHPQRRELQDVLTCIREKCTIYTAGFKLHPNAERFLKPQKEMERLFRQYPDAIQRTCEIAEACTFSLDDLKYEYPEEIITEGRTPLEELTLLAWEGAKEHYGEEIPEKVVNNINHELKFIEEMNYASYFLTVYDIVRFAKKRGILCQGRGSAANSTICYCLGITGVDPTKFDLLFERFISAARNEPPDIDVDFEHERREEVIQYIYQKYGRDRAAIVATVTQQHEKGSVRDVAKAMGLSVDTINRLSAALGSYGAYPEETFTLQRITEGGFDPNDQHLRKVLQLTRQYMGFPRQLGQHTGGFVITRSKLSELCPILNARMENRTCIEWNKDDIDALGWMKVDVLALGMLTCIRKAFDLVQLKYGRSLTLYNIPSEDNQENSPVYDMICKADTIGVFQIESRAQQSMLPRLRPRNFYDLVIEVAIVRPGPIQGDMVHPYLRRRNNKEEETYPSKELEAILCRTKGVPLFQEQAMKIAIVAGGFTPTEADQLRKSMATFKSQGMVTKFREKLVQGMLKNGYSKDYAERVFRQLEGFGSYGFPESHAASFAHLVYISAWLKCYYPDVFACALLNSMPMGFYQPAQIVSDARGHGVTVLPVDINESQWDNTLENKDGAYYALRLGFRNVKGLREEDMRILLAARTEKFTHVDELREAGVSDAALERLADADAFRSMGLDRRRALWECSTRDRSIALFAKQKMVEEGVVLPEMNLFEHVLQDYASISLSIKAHPLSFIRSKLQQLNVLKTSELAAASDGDMVRVAGLVLVRQRPGTAKGVCFMTIEDESGCANLVFFESLFSEFRKEITQSKLIMVEGKLQKEKEVIHVIAQRCYNFSKLLVEVRREAQRNEVWLRHDHNEEKADDTARQKPVQLELDMLPKGRSFR